MKKKLHSKVLLPLIFILPFVLLFPSNLAATSNQDAPLPQKKTQKVSPFSVALTGGFNLVDPSDINDWSTRVKEVYGQTGEYSTWDDFKSAYNINLELIYNFHPNVGAGIGVGYLFGGVGDVNFGTDNILGEWDYKFDLDASAIVLSTNFYGTFPISPMFTFNLSAGVDFYLAKYKQTLKSTWDFDFWILWLHFKDSGNSTWVEDTSGFNIGFHGGVSFDIKVSPQMAIVIGALYRIAKLQGFSGTADYTEDNGTTDNYEGDLGFNTNVAEIEVRETLTGDWREAVIDLSGISIFAGIKIYFGQI